MRGLPIVFTALTLFLFLPAQVYGFCLLNNFSKKNTSGLELERTLQIQNFNKSPSEFCNANLANRFLNSRKPGEIEPAKMDDWKVTIRELAQEKDFATKVNANKGLMMGPMGMIPDGITHPGVSWGPSLVPDETARLKVANKIPLPGAIFAVTLDRAIELLHKPRCDQQMANIYLMSDDPIQKEQLPYKTLAAKALCIKLLGGSSASGSSTFPISPIAIGTLVSRSRANACDGSFETVERVASKSEKNLTGAEIYKRVLNDSRYDEGLRRAAILMANKVKNPGAVSGEYFGDLRESFVQAGASAKDAEEMTWNTVGMIATGGPNLDWRMDRFPNSKEQNQKRLALQTIANVLPILDHRSSADGQLYSFPKGVSGACNTGKSYHFWYPAFLARRAALESGEVEGAAAMGYAAELFYQLSNRGGSRDQNQSSKSLIESSTFSPASNIVRADLAYAAAGARFGAERATGFEKSRLNVDSSIRGLLVQGGAGNGDVSAQLAAEFGGALGQRYADFTKKFNPASAFKPPRAPAAVQKDFLEHEKSPQVQKCAN